MEVPMRPRSADPETRSAGTISDPVAPAKNTKSATEPKASPQANLVGAPCFSRGELDFSPAEERVIQRTGFSPGLSRPALKRMIKVELLSATLKRCFPLLKQRAPTNQGVIPLPRTQKLSVHFWPA